MPRNNVPPPIDFANLSDRESSILRRKLEQNYKKFISAGTEREKSIWEYAMRCVEEDGNFRIAYALSQLKVVPVPIDDFVEDPDYLGDIVEIWPSLKADLRVMNPDVFVGEAPVHEVLIGGATGTGKTTLSQVTLLYQIYCFSCFEDPRPLFSLAPDTPIVFAIQSLSPIVTERVIYRPLRRMFERMPYAQRHLGWNKQNKSVLELENGLIIAPMLASVEAMAGQAILGGIIDEVNFMARTKNSVRVPGPRGLGGRYDQAEESYRNLTRRRKSRFITQGLPLGVVCVISSARYKGDFLDRRMEQVENFGELNVIVRRHKRYDVVPPDRYVGETFRVLIGSETHSTRVLNDDEEAPSGATIEDVPIEHRGEFLVDPHNALRDIVGIATDTSSPLIGRREKIFDAIEQWNELGLQQWVNKCEVDLAVDGMPRWIEANMPDDRDKPRWVHIDLSATRDACGIAIVKPIGVVNHADSEGSQVVECRLKLVVELAVSIRPSPGHEIDNAEIRSWLMEISTDFGFNIDTVTFDGFESRESRQWFRKSWIKSDLVSVDRTPEPYMLLREYLYRDQIVMVDSDTLRIELSQLEYVADNNKINHPPQGSKDVADAVCGAIFSAVKSRSLGKDVGYHDESGERHKTRGRNDRPRPNPQRPKDRPRPQGDRRTINNRISGSYYSSGFIN